MKCWAVKALEGREEVTVCVVAATFGDVVRWVEVRHPDWTVTGVGVVCDVLEVIG